MMVNSKVAFANAVAASALAVAFATSAYAADLSLPAGSGSPWTGFYAGAHIGEVSDPSAFTGGLQAGYNFRLAPLWLIGFEGEMSWTDQKNHNWYDTASGRLGYILPWRGWMVYGKAGAAWTSQGGRNGDTIRDGWNAGAGVEYKIAPQWSVKGEWDHIDVGSTHDQFKIGVNYHFGPGSLFGRW